MVKKKLWRDRFLSFIKWVFTTKKGILLVFVPLSIMVGLSSHEAAVRYFPDITCVACHEMKEPVRKWRESGVAKNHRNCGGCHFDTGIAKVWEMNRTAVIFFVKHFKREPNEPIKPPPEPIFLDIDKEPGYYSLVPNHRCFQCKDAKNHKPIDQPRTHSKLIRFINEQPCKDCHNHEMREGQKFYEKVLPEKEQGKKIAQSKDH